MYRLHGFALSHWAHCPQMTKANVGSLLVFDPEKLKLTDGPIKDAEGDAVRGIITERGAQRGIGALKGLLAGKRFEHALCSRGQ